MLSHRNVESPANYDAAVMWRNDRTAFKKKSQTNRAKISRRMLKTGKKNLHRIDFCSFFHVSRTWYHQTRNNVQHTGNHIKEEVAAHGANYSHEIGTHATFEEMHRRSEKVPFFSTEKETNTALTSDSDLVRIILKKAKEESALK